MNQEQRRLQDRSEDLKLRGPGDLFGIRQSGLMNFKLGDVFQDARLLQMANEAVSSPEAAGSEWLKKLENHAGNTSVIL